MRSATGLDRSTPLRGLDLRHAVLSLLAAHGEATIEQLVDALAAAGFTVHGDQPRKVVSDAMRWEIKKGRVRRTGRGRFAPDRLARATRWRVDRRWHLAVGDPYDPLDPSTPQPTRPPAWSRQRKPPGQFVAGRYRHDPTASPGHGWSKIHTARGAAERPLREAHQRRIGVRWGVVPPLPGHAPLRRLPAPPAQMP